MRFPFKNYLKKKYLRYRYKVKFNGRAFISGCTFEGFNMIADNVFLMSVVLGRGSYISFDSHICWAKIGRYCSIGDNVRIGLGRHPVSENISTHPAFYSDVSKVCGYSFHKGKLELFKSLQYVDRYNKYTVEIGNDVWIGSNVLIMDNVKIGDGAIIGGGAVVTKNVEPYSVVVGVPARVIRYRFPKDRRDHLMRIRWWDNDWNWIEQHYTEFSRVDEFMNKYGSKGNDS